MLLDDFVDKEKLSEIGKEDYRNAELNVLYVAATRAVRELHIPENLDFFMR